MRKTRCDWFIESLIGDAFSGRFTAVWHRYGEGKYDVRHIPAYYCTPELNDPNVDLLVEGSYRVWWGTFNEELIPASQVRRIVRHPGVGGMDRERFISRLLTELGWK